MNPPKPSLEIYDKLTMSELPGMTRREPGPADSLKPFCSMEETKPLFERQVVLLATASISDANIFNNGLYQNCFLLYKLAESIGMLPIFVVNEKPKNLENVPELLRPCRVAEVDDILKTPLVIKLYIEVGMSISSNLRRFMKMMGAKIVKLYLGNIINIDIETPMFFMGMNFSHHITGEQDEIWTSPHYKMNLEYAAALNKIEPTPPTAKIAPYVWDPCILTDDGRRHVAWKPRKAGEKPAIIIMEPNISFQKSSLIPILICEEYARANPEKDFDIIVLNGDRLTASGHFDKNIMPSLKACGKKIQYAARHDMISIMKSYPSAIAICHHINNEFNYMVLEFLYAGYPVLHNGAAWKDFGYYYEENDTMVGKAVLESAIKFHGEKLETYKAHSRALLWRHSIYNPDVQKGWKELMKVEG